jgi:hypothetical protein
MLSRLGAFTAHALTAHFIRIIQSRQLEKTKKKMVDGLMFTSSSMITMKSNTFAFQIMG